ncbi:MAG: hypothetical protein JNJ88_03455 [Planctomycetes bacterium]|nr:hypothetical protein [Planctomycetota bacterium]
MRSLLRLGLLSVTLFGFAVSRASAQGTVCPITSIQTQNYGVGTGAFGPPPVMKIGWDATVCGLRVQIQALQCCNTFIDRHWLLYGTAQLPAPMLLPTPPFFDFAFLYILPIDALEAPGTQQTIAPITDPTLVGMTFELQSILSYRTFGQFDGFGVTDAVTLKFL